MTVRHVAAAPKVDVEANGDVLAPGLVNGDEAVADVPADTYDVAIVPAGGGDAVWNEDVDLGEGVNTIAYAWGSLDDGSFAVAVQTIDGLHSAPGAVDAGEVGLAGTASRLQRMARRRPGRLGARRIRRRRAARPGPQLARLQRHRTDDASHSLHRHRGGRSCGRRGDGRVGGRRRWPHRTPRLSPRQFDVQRDSETATQTAALRRPERAPASGRPDGAAGPGQPARPAP